ncbi:Rgp1-domain-containing protein [Apiosordaria backusii]|uniref:Rgp1-domain-containing protein n=1 Tax=Apiosordaria backusii TaxID=314023 RepID=A0AA40EY73_9PEZI|nr:Rgp1-domain-containing protein [Apiosordaria backusii]
MSPDGPNSSINSKSNNNNSSSSSSSSSSSNIRVFVRWHEQVVFAGEEVKCTITFKNVARPPGDNSGSSSSSNISNNVSTPAGLKPFSQHLSRHLSGERLRQPSPLHPGASAGRTKHNSSSSLAPPTAASGRGRGHHRSSLSLSVPSAASRARAGSIQSPTPWTPATPNSPALSARGGGGGNGGGGSSGSGTQRNGHGHKRSVSIVSIGSSVSTIGGLDDVQSSNAGSANPKRSGRGHTRASSLQILPRGGMFNGPRSATTPRLSSSQSSPLFHASYPPERSINGRRSGTATAPDTPRVGPPRVSPTAEPSNPLAEFRFPATASPATPVTPATPGPGRSEDDLLSPTGASAGFLNNLPIRHRDQVPTINEHGATLSARVLSTTSIAGTPRSSGEFYSLSNNSSETLASEYVLHQPLRTQPRPPHTRRTSSLVPTAVRPPESLMMGYAQVQGSFTLDGSLVNLGPFEAVKRKAVVGGHGGGVIGLETNTKRDSGLLRSFGWGNITSSIGELLGGGELSTIKEMRGLASSKAVPLLSTPQSILFVDLQLGPGESMAYEYTFRLPKGLPPTHRGKAMKISYSLVIGTQRPGGAKEQQVKSVDIPFRVLGSVNSYGEVLGHDLMSPYIILRDQAVVKPAGKGSSSQVISKPKPPPPSTGPASTMASFLSYVDELLTRPQDSPTAGLLSPTAMPTSRRPSTYSMSDAGFGGLPPPTAKEAIDLAILRSNLTSSPGQQSTNRFEIARNGRRVGVVMLARPAYRLGEIVTLAIDFSNAEIPCYAVHAALETSEKILDPGLALRSEASVYRVTKKVWVSHSEATMFARRIVFQPTIPVNATPEFVTSGVGLEWKVRLEFVVPVDLQPSPLPPPPQQQETPRVQSPRLDDVEEEEEEEEEEAGEGDRLRGRGRGSGEGVGLGVGNVGLPSGNHGGQVVTKSKGHPLLEEISRDDRGGLVMVAVENLTCESFEVAVPLKVYGAVCNGLERLERDEAMEEGLVV